MSKRCEICNRPIRTGRKYCYEHRNFRETPQDRWKRQTYSEAKEYHRLDGSRKQDFVIKLILLFFCLGFFGYFTYLLVHNLFLSIIIGIVAWLFMISSSAFRGTNRRAIRWADSQIEKRDTHFSKNAKKYIFSKIDNERQERLFKESLFEEG